MSNAASVDGNTPLLSFCIPTFNRSGSLNRLVGSILACRTDEIEVIVSNNASPDNTLDLLGKLSDKRLKVFSNSENCGALFNMLRAMSLGTGKYVIYCTDQDYFLADQLDEFLELLRNESKISCGFCLLPSDPNRNTRSVPVGYDAMLAVAYRSRHPTGYFFCADNLRGIGFPEKFNHIDEVELFPLEFVFAELALKGRALIYRQGLFRPEVSHSVADHKSSTTDGRSKTAFFSPDSRLRMTLKFVKHLDGLGVPKLSGMRIEASVFLSGVWAASAGYRSIMANERLCAHYRMDVEKISVFQASTTGLGFAIRYFRARKGSASAIILHTFIVCCCASSNLAFRLARRVIS